MQGTVASTAALAVLLQDGIGDTIRVSLTPDPGAERTQEVFIAQQILQVMGIRSFMPQVTACPGCGRTSSDYFQVLAMEIQTFLQRSMPAWREEYPGVEDLSVAVMGCIVNGPGEMADADFGYVGSGTGQITLYVGKQVVARAVPEAEATDRLVDLIRENGRWVDEPVDDAGSGSELQPIAR